MRAKVVFLVIEFKFFCVFPSFDNFWEVGKSLRSQSHLNEITFDGFWTIGVAFGIFGCFDMNEMEFETGPKKQITIVKLLNYSSNSLGIKKPLMQF